jgi:hypothetical protein
VPWQAHKPRLLRALDAPLAAAAAQQAITTVAVIAFDP